MLITDRVRDVDLQLHAQPGVFAARGIDDGSRLLVEALEMAEDADVLDLGCGYGVIGIVAAKLAPRGRATLVDCDVRATRLAERNLALNGITNASVVLGDSVHDLPSDARFDIVASNPPTHSGREVLNDFVASAHKVLRPGGQLYIVINRLQSLRREVEKVFGSAELAARSKGFVVIRAVKAEG
jgi:16S rRNA (guanine1207-N2)-methyltransferase